MYKQRRCYRLSDDHRSESELKEKELAEQVTAFCDYEGMGLHTKACYRDRDFRETKSRRITTLIEGRKINVHLLHQDESQRSQLLSNLQDWLQPEPLVSWCRFSKTAQTMRTYINKQFSSCMTKYTMIDVWTEEVNVVELNFGNSSLNTSIGWRTILNDGVSTS